MALRNPQWGNEAFALRYKQVDSLRQYFPTLKEITKDNLYEVTIVLPSRKTINLRIILGQDFPYQPPTLQITPPVQHRYVTDQMVVMPQIHEKLQTWTLHTNLGKTVYEITQKFIQDQPQLLPSQPNGPLSTYGEPPPPYGSIVASGRPVSQMPSQPQQPLPPPPPQPQPQTQPQLQPQPQSQPIPNSTPNPSITQQIRPPAIPTSFPELDQKSTSELMELVSNEDQFIAFFDTLDVVKTMRQLRDDLRDGNEDLAKKNVSRTAEVDELRKLLNSKKDTLTELKTALDQKTQRQQQIMQQLSPAVLVERLAEAAAEADSQSEAIASAFLDGSDMDYKEFIKRFTEKRKVFHLRAAKKESTQMNLNMKR